MAYGSPERPEDIPAYFSDIRGGLPVRQEAVDELTERYRRIGGMSPLNRITEEQRAGLEQATGIRVYAGMKHWHPRIPEAAWMALPLAGWDPDVAAPVVYPGFFPPPPNA